MKKFVKVVDVEDLPPGERIIYHFDETSVAIFRVDEEYFAIEDLCTHDDGPVAEGELDGHSIECPRHGACFDIRDGSVLSMPAVTPVSTFEVRVHAGGVFVESPD